MSRHHFPGAPRDASYSEEGWLVIDDECWRPADWALLTPQQRRMVTGDAPAWDETPDQEYHRRQRERSRRRRAGVA